MSDRVAPLFILSARKLDKETLLHLKDNTMIKTPMLFTHLHPKDQESIMGYSVKLYSNGDVKQVLNNGVKLVYRKKSSCVRTIDDDGDEPEELSEYCGQLRYVEYLHALLDQLVVESYHPNGEVKSKHNRNLEWKGRFPFAGKREDYYDNGQSKMVVTYARGYVENKTTYYSNGQLRKMLTYSLYPQVLLWGDYKKYYENGQVKIDAYWFGSDSAQIYKSYYEDGSTETRFYSSNMYSGITCEMHHYNRDGKLKARVIYKEDKYVYRRWYNDGRLKCSYTFYEHNEGSYFYTIWNRDGTIKLQSGLFSKKGKYGRKITKKVTVVREVPVKVNIVVTSGVYDSTLDITFPDHGVRIAYDSKDPISIYRVGGCGYKYNEHVFDITRYGNKVCTHRIRDIYETRRFECLSNLGIDPSSVNLYYDFLIPSKFITLKRLVHEKYLRL